MQRQPQQQRRRRWWWLPCRILLYGAGVVFLMIALAMQLIAGTRTAFVVNNNINALSSSYYHSTNSTMTDLNDWEKQIHSILSYRTRSSSNVANDSNSGNNNNSSSSINATTTPSLSSSVDMKKTQQQQQQASTVAVRLGDHPHGGAYDANGNPGYVADVTAVRRWMLNAYYGRSSSNIVDNGTTTGTPPSPQQPLRRDWLLFRDDAEMAGICNGEPGTGFEGKAGYHLLTNKVIVGGPTPVPLLLQHQANSTNVSSTTSRSSSASSTTTTTRPLDEQQQQQRQQRRVTRAANNIKILCVIYSHAGNNNRITGVAETWGWKCDGFFAASTMTIMMHGNDRHDTASLSSLSGNSNTTTNTNTNMPLGYGSVNLSHAGPESYSNMWQKTQSIWAYVHDNFLSTLR